MFRIASAVRSQTFKSANRRSCCLVSTTKQPLLLVDSAGLAEVLLSKWEHHKRPNWHRLSNNKVLLQEQEAVLPFNHKVSMCLQQEATDNTLH